MEIQGFPWLKFGRALLDEARIWLNLDLALIFLGPPFSRRVAIWLSLHTYGSPTDGNGQHASEHSRRRYRPPGSHARARKNVGLTEAVRLAVANDLGHLDEETPLQGADRRDPPQHRCARPAGNKADRAFFDDLIGEP
jgi:hypothetical protein